MGYDNCAKRQPTRRSASVQIEKPVLFYWHHPNRSEERSLAVVP